MTGETLAGIDPQASRSALVVVSALHYPMHASARARDGIDHVDWARQLVEKREQLVVLGRQSSSPRNRRWNDVEQRAEVLPPRRQRGPICLATTRVAYDGFAGIPSFATTVVL